MRKGSKHSEESRAKMREAARHKPPVSDETRKKKSESMRRAYAEGRGVITPEGRARISAARQGKPARKCFKHSEETREKIRAAQVGKIWREETRARMREARRAFLDATRAERDAKKLAKEEEKRMEIEAQREARKHSDETIEKMRAAQVERHEYARLEKAAATEAQKEAVRLEREALRETKRQSMLAARRAERAAKKAERKRIIDEREAEHRREVEARREARRIEKEKAKEATRLLKEAALEVHRREVAERKEARRIASELRKQENLLTLQEKRRAGKERAQKYYNVRKELMNPNENTPRRVAPEITREHLIAYEIADDLDFERQAAFLLHQVMEFDSVILQGLNWRNVDADQNEIIMVTAGVRQRIPARLMDVLIDLHEERGSPKEGQVFQNRKLVRSATIDETATAFNEYVMAGK